MEKRYLQLYSIREALEKDFEGSLKRIAEIGYTGVEFAGIYGNKKGGELKKFLGDLGLETQSAHIQSDEAEKLADFCSELGLKYVIDPWAVLKTKDHALKHAERLNKLGETFSKYGIKFGYHNHAHEFTACEGGTLMDVLIENSDSKLVTFQLDCGWVANAGVDPADFIKKHSGRITLIHVKEWSKEHEWNVATGKGSIDWKAVKTAALASGAEIFVVEREHDYAGDIFTCVKEDCDFLTNL